MDRAFGLTVTQIREMKGAPLSVFCVLAMAPDKSFDVGALAFFSGYERADVKKALAVLLDRGMAFPVDQYFWKLKPGATAAVQTGGGEA